MFTRGLESGACHPGLADRSRYFGARFKPLGKVRTFIPKEPDDGGANSALVDACILFVPQLFKRCSSFMTATASLGDAERVDFDVSPPPPGWELLRAEARAVHKERPEFAHRQGEPLAARQHAR